MTINDRTTATKRVPMDSLRKTALVAGVLYLLTFVSIPTLFLYVPVHDPKYILGPGPDTGVLFGGILQHAPSTALAALPIALWEFSLGVYLIVKGFKPSPITAGMAATSDVTPAR